MDAKSRQCRTDQVPTLTQKSSGLNYLSQTTPSSQKANTAHQPTTKNDKGGK